MVSRDLVKAMQQHSTAEPYETNQISSVSTASAARLSLLSKKIGSAVDAVIVQATLNMPATCAAASPEHSKTQELLQRLVSSWAQTLRCKYASGLTAELHTSTIAAHCSLPCAWHSNALAGASSLGPSRDRPHYGEANVCLMMGDQSAVLSAAGDESTLRTAAGSTPLRQLARAQLFRLHRAKLQATHAGRQQQQRSNRHETLHRAARHRNTAKILGSGKEHASAELMQ